MGSTHGNIDTKFFGPEVDAMIVCSTAEVEQLTDLFIVLHLKAPQLMLRVGLVTFDIGMNRRQK